MEPSSVDKDRSGGRQLFDLVPSVVTFALMLVIGVLLFKHTTLFDSWLAWVFVPAIASLSGYDFWLRVRTTGTSGRNGRWARRLLGL